MLENAKEAYIIQIFEDADVFKTNIEFVRSIAKSIREDRKPKTSNEQYMLEIKCLQLAQIEN